MKKGLRICLTLLLIFSSLVSFQIFKGKEINRLLTLAEGEQRVDIYLSNSDKEDRDFLGFLEGLSKQYGASIIRTETIDGIIHKAAISNAATFPYEDFGLKRQALFTGETKAYTSYPTAEADEQQELKSLSNESRWRLEDLAQYFKEQKASVNGKYVIFVPEHSKSSLINDLSAYLQIPKADLLRESFGGQVDLLDTFAILFIAFLILLLMVFVLLMIAGVLGRATEIGIKKGLGYRERDILFDFMKLDLGLILLVSLLIDTMFILYIGHFAVDFMLALLLTQMVILTLYLLLNLLTLHAIQKVNLINLIKKRFSHIKLLNWGLYLSKTLIALVLVLFLLLLAENSSSLLTQLERINAWKPYSQVLSLESFETTGKARARDLSDPQATGRLLGNFYQALDAEGASFIYARKIIGLERHVLTINQNFTKQMRLQFLDIKSNQYLLPKSLQGKEKEVLEKLKKENGGGSQEKPSLNFDYYESKQKPVFTYQLEEPLVLEPIYEILDASKLKAYYSSFSLNTGPQSVWKIPLQSDLPDKINESLKSEGIKLNFRKLSTILNNEKEAFLLIIKITLVMIAAIFLVQQLASLFLTKAVVENRKKEVGILKVLGYKMRHRNQRELYILSAISLLQLTVISLFAKDKRVIILIVMVILLDYLLLFGAMKQQERKSLNKTLKGD